VCASKLASARRYPCLHFAARRSLDQLLFNSKEGDCPAWRRVVETVGIVGSTLLLGLLTHQIEVVFGFCGAIASTAISYWLPALIYLRLRPESACDRLRSDWHNYAFLLLGVALGAASLTNQFVDVFGAE
jgi:amino acid permease